MFSIQARENLDTQPTGYRPISFRNSKRVLPAGERLAQWNLKNNNGSSVQYRNEMLFQHSDLKKNLFLNRLFYLEHG